MRTRPWSLIFFTVLAQAAAGTAFWWVVMPGALSGPTARTVVLLNLALLLVGAVAAITHLARPTAARHALANIGSSWLSREMAAGALFGATLGIQWLLPVAAYASAAAGVLLVFAISRVYRIRTVPPWDNWTTPASFFLCALLTGLASLLAVLPDGSSNHETRPALICLAGLSLVVGNEQRRRFGHRGGRTLMARALLLLTSLVLLHVEPAATLAAALLVLLSELLQRSLFYASYRRVGLQP